MRSGIVGFLLGCSSVALIFIITFLVIPESISDKNLAWQVKRWGAPIAILVFIFAMEFLNKKPKNKGSIYENYGENRREAIFDEIKSNQIDGSGSQGILPQILTLCVLLGLSGILLVTHMSNVKTKKEKVLREKRDLRDAVKQTKIVSLLKERSDYKTKIAKEIKSDAQPVPDGVEEIKYKSDGRMLIGWFVEQEKMEVGPTVIYVHDGNTLTAKDVKTAKPFIDAGFNVFMPTWRGENGNPGKQEMCYGEIEDALNALKYLFKRKGIERAEVYSFGLGSGGTVVMLLAESTRAFKKVAVFGANPNMSETGPYKPTPFKVSPKELKLRSPALHLKDLGCPLRLYYSSEDKEGESNYYQEAIEMATAAEKLKKSVTVVTKPPKKDLTIQKMAIKDALNYFKEL